MKTRMLALLCLTGGLLSPVSAVAQSAFFKAVTNLNPTAYWPMHETAPPVQASVETNYGTLGPAANAHYADWLYSTNVDRQVGGALTNDLDPAVNFRGVNPSWALVPHISPQISLIPPFTVECWAKPVKDGGGSTGDILGNGGATLNGSGNDGNAVGVRFYWDSGYRMRAYIGNGTGQNTLVLAGLATNQWHHVVLTCDATTNFNFFVDGNFVTSSYFVYAPSLGNPFTIGASFWRSSGPIRLFPGGVDEVAVYTNDLSYIDISGHYTAGISGAAGDYKTAVLANRPALYFRMNAPAYTLPSVDTWPVVTNYGSVVGNGVYRPGVAPGSVSGPGVFAAGFGADVNATPFNGLNAFADVGFDPAYNLTYNSADPTNDTAFSVSAWFKTNPSDPRSQRLVSHGDKSWCLRITTYGFVRFETGASQNLGGPFVNDGAWHHVVATHQGTNNAIFLDGVLAASGSNTAFTNGPGSTLPVMIGADPSYTNSPAGPGQQFAGSICEVAFWNGTALSADQVRGLYSAAGVPPTILTQPVSATVNQNSAFTNTVQAQGSEPLAYQWYLNSQPRGGQTAASLILDPVRPGDAGNWYVVVTNNYGTVKSAVCSLSVISAPVIIQQPLNTALTLFAGGHAVFEVTASGAEPLGYQWRSNNLAIAGATNSTYVLTNAQLGAAASFQCVVTNVAGSANSTPVNVTVVPAPTAPYPSRVLVDNPVAYLRLNESDNGLGNGNAGVPAHDFWGGFNGVYTNVNLGKTGYSASMDPAVTSAEFGLGISSLDSYVGGIQGVDFSAPQNSSSDFSVEVWVNGPNQSVNGAGIVTKGYGNGGEQFNLDYYSRGFRFFVRDAAGSTHGYTAANLPADYAWHHLVGVCNQSAGLVRLYIDGREAGNTSITPGSGILASTDPISIGARRQGATTSYNFQYYGTMNDVAIYGYALSASQVRQHYTAVGVAPYLLELPPSTVTVSEGGTLTVPAVAVGTPPLTNTWADQVHGTNVAETIVTGTNTVDGTLVVTVPPGWNNGIFQLTVGNPYGTTNVTVILNVISGAPIFVQNLPPAAAAVAGKPYTYSVAVSGSLPFNYQWYSNNVLLAGQTGPSYSFNAASGNYRVVVSNSYGPTNSTVSSLTTMLMPTTPYALEVLAGGPVGYWPLQETFAPAPVTVETNYGTLGAIGNAYYASNSVTFGQAGALSDGDTAVLVNGTTTSYAFVPRNSPSLTLRPPLTLECWMQPTGGSGTADLISQGGSGLNAPANAGDFGGFRMSFGGGSGDGNTLQFFAYIGSGGTYNVGGTNIQTPAASITRLAWNHCVATYDGANVLLYVNGQMLRSGTTSMAPDTWTPLTLGGGRWQGQSPTRRFIGAMDEVAIYTNVLSAAQIAGHYSAATVMGNYKQTVLNDRPALYYRMDSPQFITPDPLTFPVALNYGSSAPNAAYVAGVIPGRVAGPAFVETGGNVAAPINGIFSCVDAGYDPTFDPSGAQPLSAMAWFKGNPGDGRLQTIMSHGQNWALNLDGTTGLIAWNLYGAGQVTSTAIFNDGNWHLAAGVSDGTTSCLYVDGVLNKSAPVTGALVSEPGASLLLGGNADYHTVASDQRYLAGAIAHAAVFTNALTAAQIAQLYAVATMPTISLGASGGDLFITYTGTLLSSTNAAGPYEPVSGAKSPQKITTTGPQMFYRSSNP